MKKTTLALAVASVFSLAGTAQAQDYQAEAGLSYIDIEVGDFDDSAIGLDFTYYLEQVATAGKPLAEAAFLGRNSNVGVNYVSFDELDLDETTFSGEYWHEDLYINADYTSSDDADAIELNLGYMLQDGLLAYVGLIDEDEVDENTLQVGAKYVAEMGTNYVALEGELQTNDGNNVVSLSGDYFINNETSVGVRVAESDMDDTDTAYGLGASYFFMPNASAAIEYSTQDETDIIALRVAARF